MAPRDYKHADPRNGRRGTAPRYGSWMSFVSGLGIGLVVALGIYLWSASLPPPDEVVGRVAGAADGSDTAATADEPVTELPAVVAPVTTAEPAPTTTAAPPAVDTAAPVVTPAAPGTDINAESYQPPPAKFDFYKILPEMEVPVKDWQMNEEAVESDTPPAVLDDAAAYVLQVGSFKNFEDAERAKAGLALRGISANVQRVVINGQDVWFRVHVGPVSDMASLRALRIKLAELDVDFILLKLGGAPPVE